MSSCLIGHTGFIGSNLLRQAHFDELYRSTNIGDIDGKSFDLVVCSGVTAVKWWANQNAAEDRARIDALLTHLKTIQAGTMIVISTVDVYPRPQGVDENFDCHSLPNHAYGENRLYFEDECLNLFPNTFIVRIGGVFGPGLKKNLIYDLMHDNGVEKINLDSSFQFYNVGKRLWTDLGRMQQQGLRLVNLLPEPTTMREIVDTAFPGKVVGAEATGAAASYDVRSVHAEAMGGDDGYLSDKATVLRELKAFVQSETGVSA